MMDLLKTAVQARLPLIAIHTTDLVNLTKVLTEAVGVDVSEVSGLEFFKPVTLKFVSQQTRWLKWDKKLSIASSYAELAKTKSTVIVVNPAESDPHMFNAGVLSVPPSMYRAFAKRYSGGTKKEIEALASAYAGLTMLDVVNVSKLASAAYGEISATAVRAIRRQYFPLVSGLRMINTDLLYYRPNQEIEEWLSLDGQLFIDGSSKTLQPRGLLFNGPPGVGKTAGAKHIASVLDLPLYMLDMAGVMSKYLGESEKALLASLRQAEAMAPCILLLDEVEKLFQVGDDHGGTARVLSSLLWWLQEHNSRVLTIMTTNNADKIPPELFRPGRIDRVIDVEPLHSKDNGWLVFLSGLIDAVEKAEGLKLPPDLITEAYVLAKESVQNAEQISHAKLTEIFLRSVKRFILKQPK